MTTSGPTSDDDRPDDPQSDLPPPTEAPPEAAPSSGAVEAGSPVSPAISLPDRPTTYWEPPVAAIRPDGTGWRGSGAVVGRTLDTYGSSFGLFLALSLPTAVFSGISVLAGTNLPALALVVIFTAIAGVVTGAAMMLATDDLWRGVRPALGDVLDRAAGRVPALLLSTIVVALAMVAIVIPAVIVAIALGVGTAGTASAAVGALVILFLVLGAVASFVIFRWSVSGPAIALDGLGPLAGLGRSWALARRHVIGLFGLYLALGLIGALASVGASLLQTYATQRALAAVGLGVATLLSSPLLAIATAIAYRDLAGRPAAAGVAAEKGAAADGGEAAEGGEAAVAAEGAVGVEAPTAAIAPRLPGRGGRRVSLAAVLGGGLVLGALGAWSVSASGGLIFAPDRGYVVAGTSTNAIDPCRPGGIKTTFTTSEEIWIAAVFSRRVGPGEEVVVEYLDETGSLGSAPLTAGPQGLDCYYEIDPIRGGAPGTYRIIVRQGSTIIADGSFTIR